MLTRWSPLLVAVLSFAYVIAFPLAIGRADESHLLHEAKRVFDGQVPYADFFESLTPLGLYLFAAIYWIGGVTLLAARVGAALIAACGGALLFQLVRRVAAAPEAGIAALAFAVLCLPVWPFASLHWVSTTLGLLVAAVLLADRWQHSLRLRPLLAGLLAGAAFCVQQQRGTFLALWLPLALAILSAALPRPRRWRALGTTLVWGGGGGALIIVAILGHAAWRASLAGLIDMVFGFALRHYGPTHSGQLGWAAVLPLTQPHLQPTWLWLLRVAPLFVLGEGLWLLRGRCPRDRRDLQRAALCLLAALMAASIWYLPDFIHVSFVLPFLLIPAATLVYRLRRAAAVRWPAVGPALSAGVALVAALLLGKGAVTLRAAHAEAPASFATAFGTLRGTADVQRLYEAVRDRLVAEPDGRRLLYLFPNDAWLYLALPAENVTPFSALLPRMFPSADFDPVVATLRARTAGTAVLFLPFIIGDDAVRIRDAVEAGYDPVEDVLRYRIYVRRPDAAAGGAAAQP